MQFFPHDDRSRLWIPDLYLQPLRPGEPHLRLHRDQRLCRGRVLCRRQLLLDLRCLRRRRRRHHRPRLGAGETLRFARVCLRNPARSTATKTRATASITIRPITPILRTTASQRIASRASPGTRKTPARFFHEAGTFRTASTICRRSSMRAAATARSRSTPKKTLAKAATATCTIRLTQAIPARNDDGLAAFMSPDTNTIPPAARIATTRPRR